MYEGEAKTTRTPEGKMQLSLDYSLTLEDKGGADNDITVYFQCEEAVLNQMQADEVEILWSKEIEEPE